jgi:hypothetical protein
MSVRLHRQAEALMGEADILTARGQVEAARRCWLQAAHLEAEVFAQIPPDRGKTRGIIAVSTIELFRRAGAFDEAIRVGESLLATGDLLEDWRTEVSALVDEARLERPGPGVDPSVDANGTAKASPGKGDRAKTERAKDADTLLA